MVQYKFDKITEQQCLKNQIIITKFGINLKLTLPSKLGMSQAIEA